MLLLPDRRNRRDRRSLRAQVDEPLERKTPRRREDRRDSPRVPRVLLVRELGSRDDYEKSPGDLALGGVRWKSERFPPSRRVEVAVRIPGYAVPVKGAAEIIRVELLEDELEFHAVFTDLDLKAELAIARFLDDRARLDGALQ